MEYLWLEAYQTVSTNNTINTSIVLVDVVCATSAHLDCVSTNNTINTSIVLILVVCVTSVHFWTVCLLIILLILLLY